jgi:pyruvate dehydrogenase complex dehydrogenase (E1) component
MSAGADRTGRCEHGRVIFDGFVHQLPDIDPAETTEWLDSLDAVVDSRGRTRARFLIATLLARANELGVGLPASVSVEAVSGGYDITSVSRSGNIFYIERRNGNVTRSCSDAGTDRGGCDGGSW